MKSGSTAKEPEFQLYNLDSCPFAQRTKVSLLEKEVPFSETFIDPRNKPDWFWELNPKGKLPVIVHEGKVVRESAVVLEYLEETIEHRPLLPKDPYRRAQIRLVLQFFNTEYLPAFYKAILNQDQSRREELAAKMRTRLDELKDALEELRGEGPYFAGADLSLLDVSVAPFIERHPAVAALAGCPIPDTADWGNFHRWWDAVCARPSFRQTQKDADYWVKVYEEYAAGHWGRTYFEANPGGD